ncbi:RNA polymerase sigma factor [Exiguobacterium flavidum]|uniref:RNA polymerase sigma factor n=1 Tax=Exiguobacterium flavidum TaxID=2184695 RepID=UPI000DF794DD|nr:sigma-70 family RNA polymerase sigma factor [Exiguobacterium flavidum]
MRYSDDAQLYRRIQAKDKEALELLYDRYEKLLFSFLCKLTSDRELAEEAMQEVFVKIWRGIGHYDESKGKFTSWLFTMARNAAIDLVRKRKEPTAPIEAAGEVASSEASVEDAFEWKEERLKVQAAVAKLSEDQRDVIDLMYFKGYTQQKISDVHGIPLGTVKSRIRLALSNLKKILHAERERGG